MNRSLKKQILSNILFLSLFSALTISGCVLGAEFFNVRRTAQSVSISQTKKTVVIDPGHGGEDCGAVGINGVLEKDLNLILSNNLCLLLKFAGYETIPTRTEDILLYDKNADHEGKKKILDLAARRQIAEDISPDIFVGIHMNAFPQAKYSGLTVYYSPNTASSRVAADNIRRSVTDQLQKDNTRPLKEAGKNIYLLDRISCPAILIECGFLSNQAECELLSTEEYRQKLSLIIFSSLSTFLEE